MARLSHIARVSALVALAATSACETKRSLLGPEVPTGGAIFQSYVALGNSITAGYQSGGINDSTQRQSYAFLLAQAMGTRFAYPAIAMPGCPAPTANAVTGALVGGVNGQFCALRTTPSSTDILNNLGVPGARSNDPANATTTSSNALTTFVLGGKTQVQAALQANPTFATLWIGNNDVLQAGVTGLLTLTQVPNASGGLSTISPGITSTVAEYQANLDAIINQLTAGAPGIKGVLIGVVKVSGAPILSSGGQIAAFAGTATGAATLTAAVGRPTTVHPNCTGSTSFVNLPQLISLLKNTPALPAVISCEKDAVAPAGTLPQIGDWFVLDSQEQATLNARIDGYNSYLSAKAASIGFAYYDPNPLLAAQRAAGNIPALPNLTSTTAPFGALISLDGVHPARPAHVLIANDLISVINTKYGTKLSPVQ